MKGGSSSRFEEIDRFDGGVGWIAHADETMERASHALRVPERSETADSANGEAASAGSGDDVWIIDPVDADGIDELVAELGSVRGVVVLLDRHTRDAAAVARRYDVPVYVPSFVDANVPTETKRFSGRLPDSEYDVITVVDWPGWTEAALYDGETLVVADALGTASYFRAGRERVGVHPVLRLTPPSAFEGLRPERILTGHGRGVMEDGTDALRYALDGARSRAPQAWLRGLKSMV
ncbi:MBL fold metallo-hydrolase [Halobacterium zhouii]|uniref:MBL fold metallo-hydrolase n=1 Tax=Halobacterium zhouii TaxID=2902624 RepID=UPI003D7AFF70